MYQALIQIQEDGFETGILFGEFELFFGRMQFDGFPDSDGLDGLNKMLSG